MPKISHVLETCIYGSDLAAMERFYTDVLELEKMSDEYPRHVFFKVGPQSVLLVFNPEETIKDTEIPQHGAQGPCHVAFAVDPADLDAWRSQLDRRDVAVEKTIRWPNGAESVYFRDPAGNSVEIVTSDIWN